MSPAYLLVVEALGQFFFDHLLSFLLVSCDVGGLAAEAVTVNELLWIRASSTKPKI